MSVIVIADKGRLASMTVIGKNYIFIHVPKSAGQSVTSRLGGLTKSVPGHAPLSHIAADVRRNRFAFGFVRNPWDRMVSVYAFMCSKAAKKNEIPGYQQAMREMGFKRWLIEDAFFAHDDRLWGGPALEPIQRRSQMFWLDGCDFIGQVESLETDFQLVAERIGLRKHWRERLGFRSAVPHRNRSRHDGYRGYYDSESATFVARHFAPEIERFRYHF